MEGTTAGVGGSEGRSEMEAAMSRPYSADLRRAALRACARGDGTRRRIARRYGVAESTLYDWLRQERAEGRRRPRPHAGGRPRVIDAEGEAVLRALVSEDSDATLAEYAAAFEARTGRQASAPMICKALKRLGLGRTKRRSGPASRTGKMSPGSGRPTRTSWPAPILPG
jgi:transposase